RSGVGGAAVRNGPPGNGYDVVETPPGMVAATLGRALACVEEGERRRLDALRRAPVGPSRSVRVSLPPTVKAPARARAIVAGFVGDAAGEAPRFALQLVASELVTNAVLYGSRDEPVRLELALHRGGIELRVSKGGRRIRMAELRTGRRDRGRGLEIVDALTWGWSIDSGPIETAVSVRVPIVDAPADQERLVRFARRASGYEAGMLRG